MEATIFSGWIYDHLLPHATQIKVAHPLMLRAIAAAKKKNDQMAKTSHNLNSSPQLRKGSVTDVPGPICNGRPGTRRIDRAGNKVKMR
jgi:hypothetical protein